MINQIDRLNHYPEPFSERISLGYLLLLFALFFAYLLSIPVQYHDTDMWYHMAGGRHLLETGELYNPYEASYLTPVQPFINYFWGFQVSAFSVWSVAGEPGLILYKSVMLLLAGFISARIIVMDRPFREATVLQLIVITLVIGMLCTRAVGLRPHAGSYVMIPLFIYIFMFKEKWYPALPPLAIIWANFHGVEWVVGALICGAFVLERGYKIWRTEQRDSKAWRSLIWPLLCAPAILVNPNGFHLLATPFIQDPNIWMFITELRPFEPDFILDADSGATRTTLFWLLAGFAIYAAIRAASDPASHIAGLLLALGGAILLATASRFSMEWTLLTTPLLATQLSTVDIKTRTTSLAGLLVLLLAIVSYHAPSARKALHYYPLDQHSLAYGTTEFIRRNGIEGRYAVAASHAGYIEFERLPGIQIHMDMHFPPFTSDVFHELLTAMISPAGLKHYVAKYEPDLFGVARSNEYFASHLMDSLGYTPVFFDRRIALYINRSKHPDVAQQYGLTAVDPMNENAVRSDQIGIAIAELEAMLGVVDIPPIKETLTGLLIETGQVERAAQYVEELKREQSDLVTTHYLAGRVAHLTNRCDQAVADYEVAISQTPKPAPIQLLAAECYFVMKQPGKAYEYFSAALNPYRDNAPNPLTYYQFALAALSSGHLHEAEQLLRMIPRIDAQGTYTEQAKALLDGLSADSR